MTRAEYRPSLELVPLVLAGSRLAIARMISRAEGGYAEAHEALAEIYKHSGKAHIIGITGDSAREFSRHMRVVHWLVAMVTASAFATHIVVDHVD